MRDYARFKADEEGLQGVETEVEEQYTPGPRRKVRRNENETKKRSGRARMLKEERKAEDEKSRSGRSTRL